MPAALVRFAGMLVGDARPDHAVDRLACARVISRAGTEDDGRALVRALLADAESSGTGYGAELLLARDARRAGDFEAARGCYERALAQSADRGEASSVALELAKLLEHQTRDLEAALRFAESIAANDPDDVAARRRVDRLQRKRIGRRSRAARPADARPIDAASVVRDPSDLADGPPRE